MAAQKSKPANLHDDYLALIRRFPLTPIRSDRHLQEAFHVIDSLAILDEEKLSAGQVHYLMVLSDLAKKYQSRHNPID